MNTEQLKKEFEAWAVKEGMFISKDASGEYDSMWIQQSFESYQAAAKSRYELIMELVYVLDSATSYVDRDTLLEAMQRVLNEAAKMGYVKSYEEEA